MTLLECTTNVNRGGFWPGTMLGVCDAVLSINTWLPSQGADSLMRETNVSITKESINTE